MTRVMGDALGPAPALRERRFVRDAAGLEACEIGLDVGAYLLGQRAAVRAPARSCVAGKVDQPRSALSLVHPVVASRTDAAPASISARSSAARLP